MASLRSPNPAEYFSGSNLEVVRALQRGDEARVAQLLRSGVKLDATESGNTILAWLVRTGDLKAVELALKLGANPNYVTAGQSSPATIAVSLPDGKVLELLLTHGADPNGDPKQDKRPLHVAVIENRLGAMTLLLQRGANPNVQDATGATPAHLAALTRRYDIVRALLEHGADCAMATNTGRTVAAIVARVVPDNPKEGEELMRVRALCKLPAPQ